MIGNKSRHQEMKGLTSGGAFILGAMERGGSINKDGRETYRKSSSKVNVVSIVTGGC